MYAVRAESAAWVQAVDLLAAADRSLAASAASPGCGQRWLWAHTAALQAAAAVVALRTRGTRASGPVKVWDLVAVQAPELAEWSQFFAAAAANRTAILRHQVRAQPRQADDLLREAETFITEVTKYLGGIRLPRHSVGTVALVHP